MLTRLAPLRGRRRTVVLLAGACTCSAIVAAPASAAVTVGDNLAQAPTLTSYACGGNMPFTKLECTLAQDELAAGRAAAGGLVSPVAGVVVRWRVRTGTPLPATTEAKARLALVQGDDTGGARESGYVELLGLEPGVHAFPARLPIAAGERIGLDAIVSGTGPAGLPIDREESMAGSPAIWIPPLATGETREAGGAPTSGEELLLNADVEPDADHDGYGDETQDGCPGNPMLHSSCPTVTPPPPAPPGPAGDTTPPRTKLTYPPRQDFTGKGKVLIRVRSSEAAAAEATGQLEIGSGPAKKGRAIWGLRPARRAVAGGAKATLRLKLPRKTREAALRALAAGQKAVIKVVVSATDAAGNRSGATVAVIRQKPQARS
jgi:hypothetical protein